MLIERDIAGGVVNFIPAHRHLISVFHGVADHGSIMIGKVTNRKAIHQAIAERVLVLRGSRLRHAGAKTDAA